MKICPKCGAYLHESAVFCTACGTQVGVRAADPMYQNGYYAPMRDFSDHTADYKAEDISENKVVALLPYLLGVFGILVAAVVARNSDYVKFHIRQLLKAEICAILLAVVSILFFWTIIIPIAGVICLTVIGVLKIIGFVWVCNGKAKELPILKELKFLK